MFLKNSVCITLCQGVGKDSHVAFMNPVRAWQACEGLREQTAPPVRDRPTRLKASDSPGPHPEGGAQHPASL